MCLLQCNPWPGGVFTYMGNDTNDTMDGPNVKVVKVLPSEFSIKYRKRKTIEAAAAIVDMIFFLVNWT